MHRHSRQQLYRQRQAALQMHKTGHTYQAIADALGYANRSSAWRLVREARADQVIDSRELGYSLTAERLDAVIQGNWDRMRAGDVNAARLVLRANRERARLYGVM